MEFLTGAVQKEDLGIAEILAGDYEGKNIKVKGAIHTIRDMECKCICVQEAINQIKENDGGRYDNKIIKCLLSSIARYPVGTTVKTNAEEEGVVVSQTVDPENPIIMIFGNENNGKLMLHNRLNLMLDKNISILQVI
jgi:hypothetical protein